MSPKQGLAFVKRHGVVLQAARGSVPSLAEAIAGEPIRGSWWGHRAGHEIFRVASVVSESDEVLVCKLIDGKVSYVHRRLWPAFVKLASRFRTGGLDKIWNEHTRTGAHRSRTVAFPKWVPVEILQEAESLSVTEAERILSPWLTLPPQARPAPAVKRSGGRHYASLSTAGVVGSPTTGGGRPPPRRLRSGRSPLASGPGRRRR